mmetsp:Transcript_167184/g.537015  ORF Transcript_167184/g.537015 Transcript_167184/m.537015 type:complete len:200 (-) Transcript_167184:2278-2877(-)
MHGRAYKASLEISALRWPSLGRPARSWHAVTRGPQAEEEVRAAESGHPAAAGLGLGLAARVCTCGALGAATAAVVGIEAPERFARLAFGFEAVGGAVAGVEARGRPAARRRRLGRTCLGVRSLDDRVDVIVLPELGQQCRVGVPIQRDRILQGHVPRWLGKGALEVDRGADHEAAEHDQSVELPRIETHEGAGQGCERE